MKRIGILALAFLFLLVSFNMSLAKKKKRRTGEVKDNTYMDTRYGFRVSTIENWKLGTKKETDKKVSLIRATIEKSNYRYKRESQFSSFETARPTIIITADTTSLSIDDFQEEFFGEESRMDKKKRGEYLLKLDMLDNPEFMSANKIEIDSIEGRRIVVKKRYSTQVGDEGAGSLYGKGDGGGDHYAVGGAPSKISIVEDHMVGLILLFKKDDVMYVIQFSCEREFVKLNNEDFVEIIGSWRF